MMKILTLPLILPVLWTLSADIKMPAVPVDRDGTLHLKTTIAHVLRHNLGLKISKREPEIKKLEQVVKESAYDAEHFASLRFDNNHVQQNARDFSSIQLSLLNVDARDTVYKEENWQFNQGFRGKNLTGLEWQLSYQLKRMENTINEGQQFFRPEYEAQYSLNLTQPLLQGRGVRINSLPIHLANVEVKIASREKEIHTVNKVIEVINHYYDLIFGQENLKLKRQALKIAEKIHREAKERRKVGKISPIEVAESEVEMSKAWEEVYQAEDFLRERKIEILKQLSLDAGFDENSLNFNSVWPNKVMEKLGNTKFHYEIALKNRPDYHLLKSRLQKQDHELDEAKNQKLPKLNFNLNIASGGLDDSFESSSKEIFSHGDLQWSSGFTFSSSLKRRKSKANYRSASIKRETSKLNIEQLELDLKWNIANSLRRIQTLALRQEKARASESFAQKLLDLENERMKNGQSTTTMVLDAQRKLKEAQTRSLAAKVDKQKAQEELWAVTGVLMEKNGFNVWREKDPLPYRARRILPRLDIYKQSKQDIKARKTRDDQRPYPAAPVFDPKKIFDINKTKKAKSS